MSHHGTASSPTNPNCHTDDCPSSSSCINNYAADIEDLALPPSPPPTTTAAPLRSQSWYDANADSKDHIYHRSWLQNQGHPAHLLDGRPIIAVSLLFLFLFCFSFFGVSCTIHASSKSAPSLISKTFYMVDYQYMVRL
jgi:hypothetical protein